MIDTVRGNIRIRSWPKPRPGPRHPTNEFWTNWLKAATYLYRYQPATVQWQLQEATRGTVYMPRDLFISAARGRAFMLQDEFGRRYYPMPFVQDVSDSLDAIGQFPGMMLFRGQHLWLPIQPGNPGEHLAYVTDNDPPIWSDAATKWQTAIQLANNPNAAVTWNVNSITYMETTGRRFKWDVDHIRPAAFAIAIRGASNQVGQTITAQLTRAAVSPQPIHTGGNDLVVTSTAGLFETGWLSWDDADPGYQTIGLFLKGSNNTVDLNVDAITISLRGD